MYSLKQLLKSLSELFSKKDGSPQSSGEGFSVAQNELNEVQPLPSNTANSSENAEVLNDETIKTINKLVEKAKEAEREINYLKRDAENAVRNSEKAQSYVFFGFIALVFIVAGLVFAYWQFTYSDNKDNQNQIMENKFDLENTGKDLNNFKSCLKSGGWNSCLNEN